MCFKRGSYLHVFTSTSYQNITVHKSIFFPILFYYIQLIIFIDFYYVTISQQSDEDDSMKYRLRKCSGEIISSSSCFDSYAIIYTFHKQKDGRNEN